MTNDPNPRPKPNGKKRITFETYVKERAFYQIAQNQAKPNERKESFFSLTLKRAFY